MTALKIMMLSAATVVLGGSSLLATERTGDACTLVEFTAASCPSSDMTAYCGQIGPSRMSSDRLSRFLHPGDG